MDAFASIHPVPAAWLSNSSLASFVPDYWRCLIERRYVAAVIPVRRCAFRAMDTEMAPACRLRSV